VREKRKQQRFQCSGTAEVVWPDASDGCEEETFEGEIRDLSLTGCYILSQAHLDLDRRSYVKLSLCVDGDSFTTPARLIMARAESGAAFEFVPVDPEMRLALLTVLQKLTAELTAAGR